MKKLLIPLIAVAAALGISSAQAVILNLENANANGFLNTAYFTNTQVGSTGTGVIQSFVRMAQSGNNTTAEGYNASARPVMPDVNTSLTFTHDVRLSDIPLLTNPQGLTGMYYEFLLDINQQGAKPLLSLDAVQIFTNGTALASASTYADLTSGATLRYDMDAGGDNSIHLNYNLNSGSGSGDMFMYIPVSFFAGANPNDFLYLYSMFGGEGVPYAENDGFEEWAHRDAPGQTVPDGGSAIALLGMALIGIEGLRRKIRSAAR